jgi:hypothetical protein
MPKMEIPPETAALPSGMCYPKVLICALTRVNAKDSFNNNLLLRNLLADWPRERLAQIYSGGSNRDFGFCGHQYQIGSVDRRFGKLFSKLKGERLGSASAEATLDAPQSALFRWKQRAGRFLLDSGLYELVFKLRLSRQLANWAEDFDPDIILAQGYNLTFTWLPLLLKRHLKKPIAYYGSDDWPTYLYSSKEGLRALTAPLMRRIVDRSSRQLLVATDLPFSFNDMMGEEYKRRYGKHFTTLMHCDDPERFTRAKPIRLCPAEVKSIIATGAFDDSRWPLLLDLEAACERLNDIGIPTRATVLTNRITEEGYRRVKECRFVELRNDPGHEILPRYLKGADVLYLPETFDPFLAQGFRYSISTKTHLFMFSHRPILVYGHPVCGLVNYAKRERLASVIELRDIALLAAGFRLILTDRRFSEALVSAADGVVLRSHSCRVVRTQFWRQLTHKVCRTLPEKTEQHAAF